MRRRNIKKVEMQSTTRETKIYAKSSLIEVEFVDEILLVNGE